PTLLGMIELFGWSLAFRSAGVYGEFSRTCFVYAASCSGVGGSMIETLPLSTCSGGSKCLPPITLSSGRVDGKLGADSRPLPLAETATAPGVEPSGEEAYKLVERISSASAGGGFFWLVCASRSVSLGACVRIK